MYRIPRLATLLLLVAIISCSKSTSPPDLCSVPVSPENVTIVGVWEVVGVEGAIDAQGNPLKVDSTNGKIAFYYDGTYEFFFRALPYYDESGTGNYSLVWDTLTVNGAITHFFPDRLVLSFFCNRFDCRDSDGDAWTFRILRQFAEVPTLTTAAVSVLSMTTAKCGGTVAYEGIAPVTARGVCWSTNLTPTVDDNKTIDGAGTDIFTSFLAGLSTDKQYYVRAYATNSVGTGYGNVRCFGMVTDIDGYVYTTIRIGNQWWMAENLKVTHYRNGDPIPNVAGKSAWSSLASGAYCDNGDIAVYGRLYNWYAAVSDNRGLAPVGWHVASDADWETLIDYLGGFGAAGGKMKEVGITHWRSPNTGASNESGFSGLPGGSRYGSGDFRNLGEMAFFWSSTSFEPGTGEWVVLQYADALVTPIAGTPWQRSGLSARCVKD